jgi:hypothetical protein
MSMHFSTRQKEGTKIWTNCADILYSQKIHTLDPGIEASEVSPLLSSETNESSRVRIINRFQMRNREDPISRHFSVG